MKLVTVRDYIDLLPIEIREKAYRNILRSVGEGYFYTIVEPGTTFQKFLGQSFIFSGTPEGADYWYMIAKKIDAEYSTIEEKINESSIDNILKNLDKIEKNINPSFIRRIINYFKGT